MNHLLPWQARELGLLQEINRRFLHPLGFQLAVSEGSPDTYFVMWDARSTPEGPAFPSEPDPAKACRIALLAPIRAEARLAEFGWLVQPIEGHEDCGPATLSLDDETVEACLDVAQEYVAQEDSESYGNVGDLPSTIERILVNLVGRLFERLSTTPGGVLKVLPAVEVASSKLTPTQRARARWLAREILPFAHRLYVGDEDGEQQYIAREPELLPGEQEEAKALSIEVFSWPWEDAPESGPKTLQRLEDLWSLAQPGMRFWRGGPEHKARWTELRAKIKDRLDAHKGALSEIEAFLRGDFPVSAVRDPKGLREALKERLQPLREALDEIDEQRGRVVVEMGPLQHALARLG